MILALDIGNSQLFGGVFKGEEIIFRFRKKSKSGASSDEYGIFLRSVLRENKIDPDVITSIVIGSVVPDEMHSIASSCIKYFNIEPLVVKPGLKTGLKLKCRHPLEVGADRIANAIGAIAKYPNENLLIVDFGTATTCCMISKDAEFLGGLIMPGMRLSMQTLEQNTAKLPKVEIAATNRVIGRDTEENIQGGLYYSALGLIKEVVAKLKEDEFKDGFRVIGTGGFAKMFEGESLFDNLEKDLVLKGLYRYWELNNA